MANNIDLNRGVERRTHQSGTAVFMYLDTPGVYLNAFGTEVAESMAGEAGFPIEKYRKERLKQERLQAAKSAIEAEFATMGGGVREVSKERNGFLLVHLGSGRYNIEDPDGNVLNAGGPIDKTAASRVFDQLAGPEKEPAA